MPHPAPLSSSTNPEGALTPQLLLVHASTVCSIACMVSPLQWTQNVLFPIAGIACGFLFGLFSPFKDFRNFNLTGANELNGLEKEVILETGFWTSVELQQERKWCQIMVGVSFLSGETEETAMDDYVELWEAQSRKELDKERARAFRGCSQGTAQHCTWLQPLQPRQEECVIWRQGLPILLPFWSLIIAKVH